MRFLQQSPTGFCLTKDFIGVEPRPSYAILSHTWADGAEVTFQNLKDGDLRDKPGYKKLQFCAERVDHDGLRYFWADSCCIDQTNSTELIEALNSMFSWYRSAVRCYAYLSDVSVKADAKADNDPHSWDSAFRNSRWWSRGWTLQELIAPKEVQFFSSEGTFLGDRESLKNTIHAITKIPLEVLSGFSPSGYTVEERLSWAADRQTLREEDRAYSLLGIFEVQMNMRYGEGGVVAMERLKRKIRKASSWVSKNLQTTTPREQKRKRRDSGSETPCKSLWQSDDDSSSRQLPRNLMLSSKSAYGPGFTEGHAAMIEEVACLHYKLGKRHQHELQHLTELCGSLTRNKYRPDDVNFLSNLYRRSSSAMLLNAFERRPSFSPERYIMDHKFTDIILLSAKIECRRFSDLVIQKYFLHYSKSPFQCRRVIITASIRTQSARSKLPSLQSSVASFNVQNLFGNMRDLIVRLLQSQELFGTTTNVFAQLTEELSGEIRVEPNETRITEDQTETAAQDKESLKHDLASLKCPRFLESDITTVSAGIYHNSIVKVGLKICRQYKIPFSTAGGSLFNYYDDLVTRCRLPRCNGVADFIGIVLDDHGGRTTSFLHEWSEFGSLCQVLGSMNTIGLRVPWKIRESWARDIVTAVCSIHAREVTAGPFAMVDFLLRNDGSVVSSGRQASIQKQLDDKGIWAPEVRSRIASAATAELTTFATDIFQLGLILWLLSEHQPLITRSTWCKRHVCTNFPHYRCNLPHTNPVQLPPCTSSDAPKYMNAIIENCRQSDPGKRLPAAQLLHYFPTRPDQAFIDYCMRDILAATNGKLEFKAVVVCDECGAPVGSLYFHCNICLRGNWDICQSCHADGVRCFNLEHQLEMSGKVD